MRPSVFKLSALGCILSGICFGAIFPSTGNQHGHGGAVNIVNYGLASPGVVATPTPTITPTPTPSATPIDHVADANARLSIDPTGKVAGVYQVIQDDNSTTYTWNGPSTADVAGVKITGTSDIYDDVYIVSGPFNGANQYTGLSASAVLARNAAHSANKWSVNDGDGPQTDVDDKPDLPWDATTWSGGAILTRTDMAAASNWTP